MGLFTAGLLAACISVVYRLALDPFDIVLHTAQIPDTRLQFLVRLPYNSATDLSRLAKAHWRQTKPVQGLAVALVAPLLVGREPLVREFRHLFLPGELAQGRQTTFTGTHYAGDTLSMKLSKSQQRPEPRIFHFRNADDVLHDPRLVTVVQNALHTFPTSIFLFDIKGGALLKHNSKLVEAIARSQSRKLLSALTQSLEQSLQQQFLLKDLRVIPLLAWTKSDLIRIILRRFEAKIKTMAENVSGCHFLRLDIPHTIGVLKRWVNAYVELDANNKVKHAVNVAKKLGVQLNEALHRQLCPKRVSVLTPCKKCTLPHKGVTRIRFDDLTHRFSVTCIIVVGR